MNILLPCIATILLLLVIHWFPWALVFKRKLPRLIEFGLGAMAVVVPSSIMILVINASAVISMGILWSSVVCGGVITSLAYAIDDWAEKSTRAIEAEAREKKQQELLQAYVEKQR